MVSKLVILPCHSIWTPGSNGDDRSEWALADFQVEGNDHLCFKEHIDHSMEVVESDPEAVLVISGGQTKKSSGPVSEAESYLALARKLSQNNEIFKRIFTETYARDSFENVLFSICRFYEVYQKYPESILVVGFEFKRSRFISLHLNQALGYTNVEYWGNAPTPPTPEPYFSELSAAEHKYAALLFEQDWYGLKSPLLDKKLARNPFGQSHNYQQTNPKLKSFLEAVADNAPAEENEKIRERLVVMPWYKSV